MIKCQRCHGHDLPSCARLKHRSPSTTKRQLHPVQAPGDTQAQAHISKAYRKCRLLQPLLLGSALASPCPNIYFTKRAAALPVIVWTTCHMPGICCIGYNGVTTGSPLSYRSLNSCTHSPPTITMGCSVPILSLWM